LDISRGVPVASKSYFGLLVAAKIVGPLTIRIGLRVIDRSTSLAGVTPVFTSDRDVGIIRVVAIVTSVVPDGSTFIGRGARIIVNITMEYPAKTCVPRRVVEGYICLCTIKETNITVAVIGTPAGQEVSIGGYLRTAFITDMFVDCRTVNAR
jgi:hypothetical protein